MRQIIPLPSDWSDCRRRANAADPATRLRIPEPMFSHVRAVAWENGRSMNSEILFRLGETFETENK